MLCCVFVKAYGLKPHLVSSFKLSTDPLFVEKVRDIVGLYTNRRKKPSFCVSMKKARPNPGERMRPVSLCVRDCRSGSPTITYGPEQLPCLRPMLRLRARSLGVAIIVIVIKNS